MKHRSLFLTVLVILTLTGCIPERDNQPREIKLVANKSDVHIAEAVSLQVQNLGPEHYVTKWAVSPNAGTALDSVYSQKENTITFSQKGTYTVTADVRSVSVYCNPQSGMDSCFTSSTSTIRLTKTFIIKE